MNTPTELTAALLALIEPLVADAVDAELRRREDLNRNPGQMLTPTQVGQQLQVNPRTIQKMCNNHRLTHVTIGRLVARTMHPAFMAGVVLKHDPERDQ